MESIVHYSMMLLKDHAAEVDVGQLTEKTRRLLGELEVQDPFRRRRYQELGEALDVQLQKNRSLTLLLADRL